MTIKYYFTLLLGAICLTELGYSQKTMNSIDFMNPPSMVTVDNMWQWMNGNISKQGITLDFEAMNRVGVNGVILFQVGDEYHDQGPIVYGSPEYYEILKHTVKEAERLNLDFNMHNCTGWSSSGGRWITPELSMQTLTWSETEVEGGKHLLITLEKPAANLNYYRDAIVIAFPTQKEGYKPINNWMEKAFYEKPRTGKPAYGPKSVAKGGPKSFPAPFKTGEGIIKASEIINITAFLNDKGILDWDAPKGSWTIIRMGHTTTETHNAPAVSNDIGLECDKFNKEAYTFHFNHFFTKKVLDIMQPLIAKHKFGATIDSYEVGYQNWTASFPEEFKARNGYELSLYIPILTGRTVASEEITERFLWDFRKTCANLVADNYYGCFAELCREKNIRSFNEPYNSGPFDELTIGANTENILGEFWAGQKSFGSMRTVTSIGHQSKNPVIGAEAFTSQTEFRESPNSLKSCGDLIYAQGVNRFILHCFVHQPNPTAKPGMTMWKYGSYFNRQNTWYEQSKEWIKYLKRCQYVLQQGSFVADILYFAGEDSPVKPNGLNLNPAPPKGYDFDLVDAKTINSRIKIENNRIMLPNGMTYSVLFLPGEKTISPELAKSLHRLVEQGMQLVITEKKPVNSPGLAGYPGCDKEVNKLVADIWGNLDGTSVTEHSLVKGKVYMQTFSEVFTKMNINPDFKYTSLSADAEINYTHRQTADADIFFLANYNNKSEEIIATFDVDGKQPELWDPATGQAIKQNLFELSDGQTKVPIHLDPSGSLFVIFKSQAPQKYFTTVEMNGKSVSETIISDSFSKINANSIAVPKMSHPPIESYGFDGTSFLVWEKGRYSFTDNLGKIADKVISNIAQPIEISGSWAVSFPPDAGAPDQINLDQLISLSKHANNGVKYFSGIAVYKKQFPFEPSKPTANKRFILDLGQVEVLAEVTLNGKNLGIFWKYPFQIDVTDALQSGMNKLEVKVTNTWPNRLIGDENFPAENTYGNIRDTGSLDSIPAWFSKGLPKPKTDRTTFVTFKHYNKNDMLFDSGLIGPVMIKTATVVIPE